MRNPAAYDNGAGVLTPQSRAREEAARGPRSATPAAAAAAATPANQQQGRALIAMGAASSDGLNELQRQAASFDPNRALIVFAPAGAGKTLTLVHRVLYLVGGGGLQPSQVLCLTFTRKAAVEVRNRLQRAAAVDAEVATFHGWCLRLLRTFAHIIGRRPDFRLASQTQQLDLIKEAIRAWQATQGDGTAATPQGGHGGQAHPTPRQTPASLMPSGLTARRGHDATAPSARSA